MKSYDVCECGAPLRLMERPTPKPAGTELLLKVIAAGVCHSDLHIWEGYYDLGGGKRLRLSDRGVKLPLTMGHENVGEVVAVGPDAAAAVAEQADLAHRQAEAVAGIEDDKEVVARPFVLGAVHRTSLAGQRRGSCAPRARSSSSTGPTSGLVQASKTSSAEASKVR